MRATARGLVEDAVSLCATTHGDAMTIALAALGSKSKTVLRNRFLEDARRAGEARQRVSVTCAALNSALESVEAASAALRDRIGYGDRALADAPGWVAGVPAPTGEGQPVSAATEAAPESHSSAPEASTNT